MQKFKLVAKRSLLALLALCLSTGFWLALANAYQEDVGFRNGIWEERCAGEAPPSSLEEYCKNG